MEAGIAACLSVGQESCCALCSPRHLTLTHSPVPALGWDRMELDAAPCWPGSPSQLERQQESWSGTHPYSLGSPHSSLPTGVMPPRLAQNRQGFSLPLTPAWPFTSMSRPFSLQGICPKNLCHLVIIIIIIINVKLGIKLRAP